MRANTVPTLPDGFKPFATFIGSIGVNSLSGTFVPAATVARREAA